MLYAVGLQTFSINVDLFKISFICTDHLAFPPQIHLFPRNFKNQGIVIDVVSYLEIIILCYI